jgi:hypothetical protein
LGIPRCYSTSAEEARAIRTSSRTPQGLTAARMVPGCRHQRRGWRAAHQASLCHSPRTHQPRLRRRCSPSARTRLPAQSAPRRPARHQRRMQQQARTSQAWGPRRRPLLQAPRPPRRAHSMRPPKRLRWRPPAPRPTPAPRPRQRGALQPAVAGARSSRRGPSLAGPSLVTHPRRMLTQSQRMRCPQSTRRGLGGACASACAPAPAPAPAAQAAAHCAAHRAAEGDKCRRWALAAGAAAASPAHPAHPACRRAADLMAAPLQVPRPADLRLLQAAHHQGVLPRVHNQRVRAGVIGGVGGGMPLAGTSNAPADVGCSGLIATLQCAGFVWRGRWAAARA